MKFRGVRVISVGTHYSRGDVLFSWGRINPVGTY